MNTLLHNSELGHQYAVWRKLQHGQEKIIRWGNFLKKFPGDLREQNGHEHRCSISFLVTCSLIKMRPYRKLDELLITRCADIHDIPEGVSGIDVDARVKQDNDDLLEYEIFKEMFEPLEKDIWVELQRAFLLQFVLNQPRCFPEQARSVMSQLATTHYEEALFFDALQRIDYLYYAYECHHERNRTEVTVEVAKHQFKKIDRVAMELYGFKKAVWTDKVRNLFLRFMPD